MAFEKPSREKIDTTAEAAVETTEELEPTTEDMENLRTEVLEDADKLKEDINDIIKNTDLHTEGFIDETNGSLDEVQKIIEEIEQIDKPSEPELELFSYDLLELESQYMDTDIVEEDREVKILLDNMNTLKEQTDNSRYCKEIGEEMEMNVTMSLGEFGEEVDMDKYAEAITFALDMESQLIVARHYQLSDNIPKAVEMYDNILMHTDLPKPLLDEADRLRNLATTDKELDEPVIDYEEMKYEIENVNRYLMTGISNFQGELMHISESPDEPTDRKELAEKTLSGIEHIETRIDDAYTAEMDEKAKLDILYTFNDILEEAKAGFYGKKPETTEPLVSKKEKPKKAPKKATKKLETLTEKGREVAGIPVSTEEIELSKNKKDVIKNIPEKEWNALPEDQGQYVTISLEDEDGNAAWEDILKKDDTFYIKTIDNEGREVYSPIV